MVFPVQCPHCFEVLKLKDAAADSVGKRMRCSKCSEPFVIKPYEEDADEYAEAEEYVDEEEEKPRRTARSSRSGSRKKASPQAAQTVNWKAILSGLGSALFVVLIIVRAVLRARNNFAQEAPQAPIVNPPGIVAPAAASNGAPLTDAEYEAFAKQFETLVNARDATAFQAKANWDQLLNRSMTGLSLSPQFTLGFKRGALSAMGANFSGEVMKSMGESGHYRFLRLHDAGGEKRLLFRLAPSEGGLNYHDLVLSRGASGQPEIVDFHIAISGELMSETLRGLIVVAAAGQKGSFLQKLTGQYSDFEANLPTLNQFQAQKNAGQFAEALATFKRLPQSLQKVKAFALQRTIIAGNVNEAEYLAAMTDFRQAFPNDACIDFVSIDFHLLRKEFDKALQAIDSVDRSVGGDPYLNLSRVDPLLEQGKFAEARRAADLGVQTEPGMVFPVYTLIGVGLKARDFQVVLDGLKLAQDKHNATFGDLRTVPEYAEFVKSPQFQEWLKVAKP